MFPLTPDQHHWLDVATEESDTEYKSTRIMMGQTCTQTTVPVGTKKYVKYYHINSIVIASQTVWHSVSQASIIKTPIIKQQMHKDTCQCSRNSAKAPYILAVVLLTLAKICNVMHKTLSAAKDHST